jgi:hypothetical protein
MLYEFPTPVLVLMLVVAMVLAVEGGLRLGGTRGRPFWANAKEILTALTAATLALLGLMLAFTFNQAASRYDGRVSALSHDANAILVVGHFLDHLVPEAREEGRDLLRRYAEERLAYLTVGHDPEAERAAVERSRELAAEIWTLAGRSENYRETEPTIRANAITQLTEAVSEMSGVAREREQARERRVPEAVLGGLFAMATLAAGMLSYMAGATGYPDRFKMYAFLSFLALVIYLIVDLDRPRRGLMRLSPESLEETLRILSEEH